VYGILLTAALAAAQQLPAYAEEEHRFAIQGTDTGHAIQELGNQAGVQIFASSEDLAGKHLHDVTGVMSTEAAFTTLLTGTGLAHRYVGDHIIALLKDTADTPADTAVASNSTVTATVNDGSTGSSDQSRFRLAESAPESPAGGAAAVPANGGQTSEKEAVHLEEVLVTAEKKSERLQDVPVPVSVLNTDVLAENNQTLLRDYFSLIPGFNVTPNFVQTQNLAIRGVTTGGLNTPTVGVVIDDVPFGASTGSHGDFVPDIDPGQLERVEILRGPQGTLYGANSMGGLIKFVTVDPSTDALAGRIEAGVNHVVNGTQPGYNVRGSANIPVSDTLAIGASAFSRQDAGYIDNPIVRQHGINREQTEGARLSALWRPADSISLKLSAMYQQSEADGLSEGDIRPGLLQQDYLVGSGRYDGSVQAYSAILKAKLGGVSLTSLSGYNVNEQKPGIDETFIFGSAAANAFGLAAAGAPYLSGDRVAKFTQELRASMPIGQRFEWMVGGYYTHEHDTGYFNVAAEDLATGRFAGSYWYYEQGLDTFEEYAGFTDLTFHVTDSFDIRLGGRESRYNIDLAPPVQTGPYIQGGRLVSPAEQSSADDFTYLVTPSLKVSPNLMIYARFASGYRPGTPNLPAHAVPRESSPDKTTNYEIGAKGDFYDNVFSFDTSVYYIDWSDIQLQLRDPITEFVFYANGSRAKSQGVELSLTARPASGLSISTWFDYDDAVLTEPFPSNSPSYGAAGDRLPLSSRYSGNLSLEQEFHLRGDVSGFAGATASYVGSRIGTFGTTDAPERQYYPAYTKFDLHAGLKYDSWTVNAYANNVTDKRALIGGGIGYFPPYAQVYITPRTVGISATKSF